MVRTMSEKVKINCDEFRSKINEISDALKLSEITSNAFIEV